MYCRDEGLGVAPLVVASAATGVIKGVKGVIGKIFGGGPSEEQLPGGAEYEYRRETAESADSMARSGSVNAFHFLGGLGRVKGLPFAFRLAGLPKRSKKTSAGPAGESYGDTVLAKNWKASKWGSSFAPVQTWAANDYRDLESAMYATPATPVQPGGPAPVTTPVLSGVISGGGMPLLLGGLAIAAALAFGGTSRRGR